VMITVLEGVMCVSILSWSGHYMLYNY
jgi:hypothetical protein